MRGGLSALRIDYFFVIGKMRLAWINYLYISNVIPLLLTVQVPTPQIAQTNSNNSSGVFECVWPFVKLEVKGLTLVTSLVFWGAWNYITFIQKLVALIKVPKLHRNIKNCLWTISSTSLKRRMFYLTVSTMSTYVAMQT